MPTIDEYDCPVEDCEKAYPHRLLAEYHALNDHDEYAAEVQRYIDGENDNPHL